MGRKKIYTDDEVKEKYLEYQHEYYLKTKAKRQEYKKKYYKEHKDEYLERWYKWLNSGDNRAKHNARQRDYVARKRAKRNGETV